MSIFSSFPLPHSEFPLPDSVICPLISVICCHYSVLSFPTSAFRIPTSGFCHLPPDFCPPFSVICHLSPSPRRPFFCCWPSAVSSDLLPASLPVSGSSAFLKITNSPSDPVKRPFSIPSSRLSRGSYGLMPAHPVTSNTTSNGPIHSAFCLCVFDIPIRTSPLPRLIPG